MASGERRPETGGGISLSVDVWGRLVLVDPDGQRFIGVEPVRAFPISEPGRWVSLCDAEGREVFFVDDLAGLAEPARKVLELELAAREFVPEIRRIIRSSGGVFPLHWDVETDRGATRLELDTEDDFRRIGPHRILITDARKSRFLVRDARKLDAHSRRILERHI
jgi:hypothetical protein